MANCHVVSMHVSHLDFNLKSYKFIHPEVNSAFYLVLHLVYVPVVKIWFQRKATDNFTAHFVRVAEGAEILSY